MSASEGNAANSRRARVQQALAWLPWVVNALLLVAAAVWIATNGRSAATVHDLGSSLASVGVNPVENLPQVFGQRPAVRWAVAGTLAVAVSVAAILVLLFVGPRRHRRTLSWLCFTTLLCGWLALLVSWPDLYWHGQQWRLRGELASLQVLVDELGAAWPQQDGETELLGPFLAYPKEGPRVLLLLGYRGLAGSRLKLAAVEGTPGGPFRFQLAGPESGPWLEWHPAGSTPASFAGGLATSYQLQQSAHLNGPWYLARYEASVP